MGHRILLLLGLSVVTISTSASAAPYNPEQLESGLLSEADLLEPGVLGEEDLLEPGVLGEADFLEPGLVDETQPPLVKIRRWASNILEPGLLGEEDLLEEGLLGEDDFLEPGLLDAPGLESLPRLHDPADELIDPYFYRSRG